MIDLIKIQTIDNQQQNLTLVRSGGEKRHTLFLENFSFTEKMNNLKGYRTERLK